MVRILLCGDVRGGLKRLCDQVDKLNSKLSTSQQFQAVFCVGEFSGEKMELDVRPSVPIHFIDCGPRAKEFINDAPQGDEVGPGLNFLGHFGVTEVAGLKIAFLSGRQCAELFQDVPSEATGEVTAARTPEGQTCTISSSLKQKYGAQDGDETLRNSIHEGLGAIENASKRDASWEELKAAEQVDAFRMSQLFIDGCYTPLAMQRLQEEIAEAGNIDLLLTSEWPEGCMRGVAQAWPEEMHTRKMVKAAVKQCSASPVAAIVMAAEPKYHVVGLGGVFWRRAPWKHTRRGEVVQSTGELKCGVCRLVSLGALDGSRPGVIERKPSYYGPRLGQDASADDNVATAKPQKWLHGLELEPSTMPSAADDATPNPWSEVAASVGPHLKDSAELRLNFDTEDKEERRRWLRRFGCVPEELQRVSDKLEKDEAPKEKKDKHKSLYKVSEKEKKRRKTGGDGHLPFHAKERMSSNNG